MSCKCNEPIQALGLPNCQIVPERIVRAYFTTDIYPGDLPPSWPSSGGIPWEYEPSLSPPNAVWPQLYALATPLADDVASERPEGVREEIGVNSYYVRSSARSFTFTFARKTAELQTLLSKLRCQQTLGVILVDAAGVAWGRRMPVSGQVAPIPVLSSSLEARMEFATASTVQKQIFSFQTLYNFEDGELVPIWQTPDLLTYVPPIALTAVVSGITTTSATVVIYAAIATAPSTLYILLPSIPTPTPDAFDASGANLGGTTWTQTGPGQFTVTFPAGTAVIRFSNSQLTSPITPAGFDWFNFRIQLT